MVATVRLRLRFRFGFLCLIVVLSDLLQEVHRSSVFRFEFGSPWIRVESFTNWQLDGLVSVWFRFRLVILVPSKWTLNQQLFSSLYFFCTHFFIHCWLHLGRFSEGGGGGWGEILVGDRVERGVSMSHVRVNFDVPLVTRRLASRSI